MFDLCMYRSYNLKYRQRRRTKIGCFGISLPTYYCLYDCLASVSLSAETSSLLIVKAWFKSRVLWSKSYTPSLSRKGDHQA
jgi:hypothetical protein